jgi:hypothetical protein
LFTDAFLPLQQTRLEARAQGRVVRTKANHLTESYSKVRLSSLMAIVTPVKKLHDYSSGLLLLVLCIGTQDVEIIKSRANSSQNIFYVNTYARENRTRLPSPDRTTSRYFLITVKMH